MPTKKVNKVNPWMISTLLLAGLIIGIGSSNYISPSSKTENIIKENKNSVKNTVKEKPAEPDVINISIDDDATLGDKNAKVTMVEFSDFQCPFCTKFYKNTLSQIKEKYVDTGKVYFVYRDFPIGSHQKAKKAAESAECARNQQEEKFWGMHDLIFDNQVEWAKSDDANQVFKRFASEIGLDSSKFSSCLDEGKFTQEVENDLQDGIKYGVTGTPTFFINGKKLVGAQDFSKFESMIEAEL